MTLGSLFDGSGGFPLGAILCGITPVWAAEVEPYPIKVTKTRLPFMKHLGSVTEIDGAKIEPVDIITFGSPCQDLSIAGKREGLQGNRSGLFHEAMRIVKEMRIATNGEKPRYIVWENVTGAFSSNKGEDFRVVLETIMQAKDETFAVPRQEKWNGSGCIVADSLSLSHGEHLTLSIGEYPKEERESTLSQILMVNVPEKYFLSKRGCEGILHRAFKSGKPLPKVLEEALTYQANIE